MNELELQIETRPQPGYALLTFGEYYQLNHDLSIARGWQLDNDTERYAPMNTPLAKINIEYDEEGNEISYEVKLVMPISSEIQENYADLLTGIELVNNYQEVEGQITEIIAVGLNSDIIDWTLLHYLRVGTIREGLVLWLEDEARSSLSDEAVQKLNDLNVTIITVE
jgi:hypothetical protein